MIMAVCGYSGVGKTSFIEELLPRLEEYSVAVVKHTDRQHIDVEGTDTARYRGVGSDAAAIIAADETALFFSGQQSVAAITDLLNTDVVLLEGFKSSDYEKIWLGDGRGSNVVMQDPSIEEAASYIRRGAKMEQTMQQLPGLDCGDCGYESCHQLAQAVATGNATLEDCVVPLPQGGVTVTVDGTAIPLNPFVQSFVENTIRGMLRSLKGGGETEGKTVRIELPGTK